MGVQRAKPFAGARGVLASSFFLKAGHRPARTVMTGCQCLPLVQSRKAWYNNSRSIQGAPGSLVGRYRFFYVPEGLAAHRHAETRKPGTVQRGKEELCYVDHDFAALWLTGGNCHPGHTCRTLAHPLSHL